MAQTLSVKNTEIINNYVLPDNLTQSELTRTTFNNSWQLTPVKR